jgi:probable HAF family extracellular repeat protein
MSRFAVFLCIAALSIALAPNAHAHRHSHHHSFHVEYRIIDIPDFTADHRSGFSTAESVNDKGEVLATGSGDQNGGHAFVWRRGRVIGEIDSPDPQRPYLNALQINNRSQVVGTFSDGAQDQRVFLWERGHIRSLGVMPGGTWTYGTGINDFGEVAGVGSRPDFYWTMFRWYKGHFTPLDLDATRLALSGGRINNRGEIVGTVSTVPLYPTPAGPTGPFVWSRDGRLRFLDSLPGFFIPFPRDINDRGQIIGNASANQPPFAQQAVLWDHGTVQLLGTPEFTSSEAKAINNFGVVVGSATSGSSQVAMIWRDGEMDDLNDLIADDDPLKGQAIIRSATDINNWGWITADARKPNQDRGYLLIPFWVRDRD